MSTKIMLLSGRPGSGKSEMLIAYLNTNASSSILINLEQQKEDLYDRGLNKNIKVINSEKSINLTELLKYETIGFDFAQLFDKAYLHELIRSLLQNDKRVIVIDQMRRDGTCQSDVFKNVLSQDTDEGISPEN